MFRGWADRLGPGIDVLAPQLPGRENRIGEPAVDSLEPLIDALQQALLPRLDRRFALFGHSMGALLCYELARRLVGHDLAPDVIFVSAYPAPHRPTDDAENVHLLDDDALVERMRSYAGTPAVVLDDPELCRMLLPTLRADFRVCETYRHQEGPPLPLDIVAFAGRSDPEATAEAMIGWHELTAGGFTLHRVEGNHFFLDESFDVVLGVIADRCRRVGTPASHDGPTSWRRA